jgi:hypothetical protein
MVSHLDKIGLAFLGVYLLFFVCIGSLSHRIRFIGTNARSRSGWSWTSNYYSLLVAFLISGVVLFLILQANINLDKCAADSVLLYRDTSLKLVWKYTLSFGRIIVAFLCAQLIFVRRSGSRRIRQGAQWSFDINWEAVCQVCLFHIGCRTTYFVCVAIKALVYDNTCYPVGTQSNAVSFDAQYASFWLLTVVRLPISLSSHRPNSVDSYSLATYLVRSCQGYSSTSELLFLLTTACFLLSQIISVFYFDYGQGRHTLRQISYGFAAGVAGHGLSSSNIGMLFADTPEANMPTTRHQRIRHLIAPVTNAGICYVICAALGYRFLRDKHRYLMWHEVLAFAPALGDACIALLFVFAVVRKGARRQEKN